MKTPPFIAPQFTATSWSTQGEKVKFANHFVHFVESGFPLRLFYKWFYIRLSMTFGHIAHYNRWGFYDTWFSDTQSQLEFLKHTKQVVSYGDPAHTFSDVERAIQGWLNKEGARLILEYTKKLAQETEVAERKEFERLKAKYDQKFGPWS